MTRAVVLVESSVTGAGADTARLLRRRGVQPVVLSHDPDGLPGYLRRQLAAAGAEILACDTGSVSAIVQACCSIAARAELAGLTCVYEYYTSQAAEAAEALGLPGPDPAAVRRCRSKAAQRDALESVGGLNPRYAVCHSRDQAVDAASRSGLPVVVKPTGLTGSVMVSRCATLAEVASATTTVLDAGEYLHVPVEPCVVVEEYVGGREFSVEVFHGQAVALTEKLLGPAPAFVELAHVVPAEADALTRRVVTAAAERAVEGLGLSWGPAHVEIRLVGERPEEGARVIEVNPRLGGDRIPELVRLATGVNMTQMHVEAVLGGAVTPGPALSRVAAVRFLLGHGGGRLQEVGGLAAAHAVPGVTEVHVRVGVGQEHRLNGSNQDRVAWAIAVGEDRSSVLARAGTALDRLDLAWARPAPAGARG